MHRSYEPEADRQLDEGAEPHELCQCGDELLPGEGSMCSNCADEASFDDRQLLPDDEDEAAWLSRELQRYSR